MEIIFRMAVRDMFPELLNTLGADQGRSFEKNEDIYLRKVVDWPAVPREGDEVDVGLVADPRGVQSVAWTLEGRVDVWLQDFDADEVSGGEAAAVEALLESGWEIDWD